MDHGRGMSHVRTSHTHGHTSAITPAHVQVLLDDDRAGRADELSYLSATARATEVLSEASNPQPSR